MKEWRAVGIDFSHGSEGVKACRSEGLSESIFHMVLKE